MKTITDYLTDFASATGCTSDYQTARRLSVTRQAVSHYRTGKGAPGIDTCWQIADALHVPLAEVIAAAEVQRATCKHDPQRAQLWRARLSSVSAGAVTVFSGVALLSDRFLTAAQCILCQIADAEMWRRDGILPALRNRSKREQSAPFLRPIGHKGGRCYAEIF